MLRYVAVNDAYACLFGDSAPGLSETRSRTTDDLLTKREALERRALFRAAEERVEITDAAGRRLGTADVERFITENGALCLFGQMPPPAQGRRPGSGPDVRQSVENALDMLDVGIAVFDGGDRLIYRNGHMQKLYGPVVGGLHEGMPLRDFFDEIYAYGMKTVPELMATRLPDREDWVALKLSQCQQPFTETTDQACDGRWLRSLNRRLDNGLLLIVRLDVSDIKSQEMQLREHVGRNRLYHSIIEELPVAVFARDRDHRMVFANAAYATLFGHAREAVIGHTELDIHGARGEVIYANNERVLAGGDASCIEEDLSNSAGQPFAAMTRTSRVSTEDGATYLIGSVIDVSVLKSREEALREAQAHTESLSHDLAGILGALPTGVLVFNEQLRIDYVNDAFFEACDLGPALTLQGAPVHRAIEAIHVNGLWPEGDEICVPEQLSLLFERGSEATLEFATRGGRSVAAASRNLPGGKTLLTFADLSALRKQEREITEAQRQLENIGQFMQDAARVMSQGLFIIENDVIILSNPAAAEIMRLPPGLIAPGSNWSTIFAHCVARGDFGSQDEALQTLRQWTDTIRTTGSLTETFTAAGEAFVQFVVTLSEAGHIMVVFNDLTGMKQREEELERLLARSEAADRAKTDFLANMGHEIRTPINGVLGMTELLAKTNLDARQRTFTDIISKSAATLLTIFNDILDFSKIDSGQMQLKPAPFDPLDAVEDVCSLHSSAAAEKNIDLMVRAAPGLPKRVVGDAGRFRQIVGNFVSNAIRHTEKGHVLVDLGIAEGKPGEVTPGEVTLSIRVEDTGIGMDPHQMQTVFDKFSHAGASQNRSSEGTGLGLAITSGLVALFGGSIGVESEPGFGSAFTARLPMAVVQSLDSSRPVPTLVRGARILVVDDNDISRSILVDHLDAWGFDCCAADLGQTALDILTTARDLGVPVDAVLIDNRLPDMDGNTLCRKIRADKELAGPALMLMASMDAATDLTLVEGLQVQAHLTKPVRANILQNTVIEVLRARHARREKGDSPEAPEAVAPRHAIRDIDLPAAAHPDAERDAGGRIQIVVAEDNEVNAIVFSQILSAAGYRFALAGNGQQAIALWQQHAPDVILMDISMPVMDGLEATRRIRHMERVADLAPVAIIAVTAHDTAADRDLCLSHGMDDYLAKPVSPEMLEEKLCRWLESAEPVAQLAE
nr:response regulator [uncultured Gellertiella sp.]